eukprot:318365-Chlamydomonas_euryale.AAC.9
MTGTTRSPCCMHRQQPAVLACPNAHMDIHQHHSLAAMLDARRDAPRAARPNEPRHRSLNVRLGRGRQLAAPVQVPHLAPGGIGRHVVKRDKPAVLPNLRYPREHVALLRRGLVHRALPQQLAAGHAADAPRAGRLPRRPLATPLAR